MAFATHSQSRIAASGLEELSPTSVPLERQASNMMMFSNDYQ
jgi:hypothetical protein